MGGLGGRAGAALSGGAGYDYQSGPGEQSWRGALGFASVEGGRGSLTLAAVRYEDNVVGKGVSGFANVGAVAKGPMSIRAIGIRSVGDGAYRAWRVRIGLEFRIASGRTVGFYIARFEDNVSSRLDLVGSEIGVPIARGLVWSGGASYGRWNGGRTNVQGEAGLVWSAGSRVQLLGQLGFGSNVVTVSQPGPSGGGLAHLPILGDVGSGRRTGVTTTTENEIAATALLGLRVLVR